MNLGQLAIHAAGTLAWIAVAHGARPRLATSLPGGAAVASALAALMLWGTEPAAWLAPGSGVALGALLALLSALATRRLLARGSGAPAAVGAPLARLWRGELPVHLGLAALGGWLVAVWWAAVAVRETPLSALPRLVGLLIVLLWAAGPVGTGVALVGLWRSTRRDAPRAPWRPLAWIIRLALAAAWLTLLLTVAVSGRDALAEYGRLAFGPSERGRYALRVLRGGRELELSGGMGFGLTEDVEAALAANPGVRLLHLDSGGGRFFEGQRLADLVRRRRLGTYVSNRCASACVLVLAAGEPRLLARGAEVGLHRPSSPGWETGLDRRRSAQRLAEALVSSGVDRAFAERGAATPNESIWQPTHEEIFAARLATRHARHDEVAISGMSAEALERLPLTLRERPLFQALFEFERPVFDHWLAAMRSGHERGVSLAEALAPVQPELAAVMERVMERDLPRASDRTVRRFYERMVDTLRAARRQGDARCAAALQGKGFGAPTGERGAPPDGLVDALVEAMVSARLDPVEPGPLDAKDPSLIAAYLRVEARQPGFLDLVADLQGATNRSPAMACVAVDGVAALYEELLRLPPAQGTPLLRTMASQSGGDGEPER